ncbi:MAG: hypothetical protein HWD58_17480 [Bacteroidota bacterium]|nr:MAG: hypothetical protein HWD58_17480 [Bacteroidota bacterium]
MPYFCAMKDINALGKCNTVAESFSCEKDVNITLATGEKQIVVEGLLKPINSHMSPSQIAWDSLIK